MKYCGNSLILLRSIFSYPGTCCPVNRVYIFTTSPATDSTITLPEKLSSQPQFFVRFVLLDL